MAELLFRIGRFAARRHWTVIGAWLALLALSALSAGGALYAIGWLLDVVLERVPSWIARQLSRGRREMPAPPQRLT